MQIGRILLALLMVVAGPLHFIFPRRYLRIMPSWLPAHLPLVYLSGALEVLLGAGLLVPPVARADAWALILLLLAIFPANVNMAIHQIGFTKTPPPAWILWARLPLQFALIAWAYSYT